MWWAIRNCIARRDLVFVPEESPNAGASIAVAVGPTVAAKVVAARPRIPAFHHLCLSV